MPGESGSAERPNPPERRVCPHSCFESAPPKLLYQNLHCQVTTCHFEVSRQPFSQTTLRAELPFLRRTAASLVRSPQISRTGRESQWGREHPDRFGSICFPKRSMGLGLPSQADPFGTRGRGGQDARVSWVPWLKRQQVHGPGSDPECISPTFPLAAILAANGAPKQGRERGC